MTLVKPALANAVAGKPITADAWNGLVGGLNNLYDNLTGVPETVATHTATLAALGTTVGSQGSAITALQALVAELGREILYVQVVTPAQTGADEREASVLQIPNALVVAVPQFQAAPVLAVPPVPGNGLYTLSGLKSGVYTLHVIADGFVRQEIKMEIPTKATAYVTLTPVGLSMPDVFGLPATQALAVLAQAGLGMDLILDASGREIPKTSLPPASANAPVLMQSPAPGAQVDPTRARVRLVIASVYEQEPVVVMPNLSGLSLAEATKALEGLGLRVGTSTIKS
jgi:hypothetical protein